MKLFLARFPLLLLTGLLLLTLLPVRPAMAAEPRVITGIAPLTFLVEQIGGERVRVATLIPPGQDPHTFEPRPGQVAELGRADLYFSLTMPFEEMLLARMPASERGGPRVIEVTGGISKLPMLEHHDDHQHEHHHQGELDPHVWLGPAQLLIIGEHIEAGLSELDPSHAAAYRQNLARLQAAIKEVHSRNRELLTPLAGHSFLVYHPAFGYFARAYDLEQKAVEIGGKSPSPRQLIRLVDRARQQGVRVIFVQPQFDQRSAAAVARAIDGQVVPMDPLAADVLHNLEQMAATVHEALANRE